MRELPVADGDGHAGSAALSVRAAAGRAPAGRISGLAAEDARASDFRALDARALDARAMEQVHASGRDSVARTKDSIGDYLTDGSLARLVDELSELLGVRVELRNGDGRLVIPAEGRPAWKMVEAPPLEGGTSIPLKRETQVIGALVVGPGEPRIAGSQLDAKSRLMSVVNKLALATNEVVDSEAELRHKLRELSVVARLTGLLSRAVRIDRVLEVALESAIEVLSLDAGAIVLLKDSGDGAPELDSKEIDLELRAARNLSQDWLRSPLPLSKDRLFDRLALRGEVVVCEDIQCDERVLIPERAKQEGLGAAINAGLVFQSRAIGVMRLYSRVPRTFDESEKRLLGVIAQQAAIAVEQSRLLRMQEEEEHRQRQLSLAADVQRRMMPNTPPNVPGVDVATRWLPSFELGGDFYDVFELHGHLALAIGDVVGKGVAAALLMSAVRASLRAYVQDLYDLDEVVARVNAALCRDTRDGEFATLWYGVIDPVRLRLTYCSAGHEPPMVVRVPSPGSGRALSLADVDELGVGGMAVGIDPHQRYQRGVFDLRPNDTLIAYTDGLLDARNFAGEKFGRAKLRASVIRVLSENPSASATHIAELLQWELRRFTGLAQRTDDETMMVVRIRSRV
ncbi:MAG: GAF domain-containing SpoIIE family protein phosphatase [Planctomycetota bacterium]|nr:GAF domain-containing SpoIIE family protein phosphatase [Planctomycetota bacterium]